MAFLWQLSVFAVGLAHTLQFPLASSACSVVLGAGQLRPPSISPDVHAVLQPPISKRQLLQVQSSSFPAIQICNPGPIWGGGGMEHSL